LLLSSFYYIMFGRVRNVVKSLNYFYRLIIIPIVVDELYLYTRNLTQTYFL
jgi:hypothetical protein